MKPQGEPLDFVVNQRVRYKPGTGTYGYEDLVEQDGRIPALVVGHTRQRVRIRLLSEVRQLPERRVDASSLELEQAS